jgi:hypothetical protein
MKRRTADAGGVSEVLAGRTLYCVSSSLLNQADICLLHQAPSLS